MRPLIFSLILATALVCAIACDRAGANDSADRAPAAGISDPKVSTMKLRIEVEGTVVTATLVDNEASMDFVSLLPLTLTLEDHASTEKITDLPKRLSTAGAPPGFDPSVGDIAYYAPWGNLAVYYKDFGYSEGLVKLGTIDSGVEILRRPGPLKVTIERMDEGQS